MSSSVLPSVPAARRLLGSGATALVIKVAGAGLSYLMFVALARLLDPQAYGHFAFGFNLAIVLAALAGLGFSTGILRYWPQHISAGAPSLAKGTVKAGYFASVAGILIVSLIAAAVLLLGQPFGVSIDGFTLSAVILLSLAICIGDYTSNLLRALGSTVVSMLPRDVLWRVMTPLALLALAATSVGLSGAIALAACAAALLVLTAWQLLHVRRGMAAYAGAADFSGAWKAVRPSLLPLWIASLVYAVIQQFDVVIVGSMLGATQAGAYFAAQKTAMLLGLVMIAAGMVTAPTMSSLYHGGKVAELQAMCRTVALVLVGVSFLGFCFLVLIGKPLLALFDPGYVSAYPVLVVLALAAMVDAVAGPTAYLMQMTAYERQYLWIMVASYLCVIVAQLILIPLYGVIGAAAATAGGVILWNLLAIFVLRRRAGLDPSLFSLISSPRKVTPRGPDNVN